METYKRKAASSMDIVTYKRKPEAEMSSITIDDFRRYVSENNTERCKNVMHNMSKLEFHTLVNTPFDKEDETVIHIAADLKVDIDVWKILLQFASEKTLYERFSIYSKSSLEIILAQQPYYQYIVNKETPLHKLYKVKYWLELTKKSNSKNVRAFRLHILRELCRLKPSADPNFISKSDIENLGKELIHNYHVDVNELPPSSGLYPLLWAFESRNIFFLRLLLLNGADPNCIDDRCQTALHLSRFLQNKNNTFRFEAIDLLIEKGASLSVEMVRQGFTAFHCVCISLIPEELDVLLTKYQEIVDIGSNILPFPFIHGIIVFSITDNFYKNKQFETLQEDLIAKIKVLQKHGVSMDLTDIHGRTILHYACWMRLTDVVRFLVSELNVNPHFTDVFGRGCPYYSIASFSYMSSDADKDLSTLKYLESVFGTEYLNKKDMFGRTIGELAVCEDNTAVSEYLSSKNPLETLSSSSYNSNIYKSTTMRGIVLIKTLLRDPNNGPLKKNKSVNLIEQNMKILVNKLADNLNQLDKRFECTVELAGSMSEGTKVNPPDEFDFQFKLKILSQYVEVSSFAGHNDVNMRINDKICVKNLTFDDFIVDNQSLNNGIFKAFNTALYNTLRSKSFWEDLQFYWLTRRSVGGYWPNYLTTPLYLKLVGKEHAGVNISVDLVPVIVLTTLPSEMENVIPKEVMKFVRDQNMEWPIICREDTKCARLSFFAIERWILRRLAPEIREAYSVTKCIRNYINSITGDDDVITSYMLKNALFYELDPQTSYSLINSQLIPCKTLCVAQKMCLQILREIYTNRFLDKESFVYKWACKIIKKLDDWFKEDIEMPMYCRPDVYFPDVLIIEDTDGNNPVTNALQELRALLCDVDE